MSAETLYGGGSSFQRPGDADVLTKRRQSTGKEVHYFIGPIRETLEEAEADRKRWEDGGERARLRERVKAMRADAKRKRTEAGRQELPINMHRQSGREEAFGEVLILLAEPGEVDGEPRT